MEHARYLRHHADWFLDLATKSSSGAMFEKLVALAVNYQRKAVEAEQAEQQRAANCDRSLPKAS